MDFIILALATFRLSSLIANEDGPLGLFDWLRVAAGVERDAQGEQYGTNNFAVGLICIWCVSMWAAIILTPIYLYYPVVVLVAYPFALSAVALILGELAKYLARYNNG